MAFLEVKNYKKKFGGTQVLNDVSFTLEKGQVLALIGSSGGGKTTLLRCLNFLEIPDEGQLYLNGELLFSAGAKLSEREIRKKRLRFGLVFQQFNLFPQYTALKNVMLALTLLDKERIRQFKKQKAGDIKEYRKSLKAQAEERAAALLRRVGLEEKKELYPHQLSGGQQQRVAIARALALNPDILCFDEPTSALDPELTGEVLKVIKGLKSAENTMIVVTHEMEFAKSVADVVIYMADGVIEEAGTPQEVFENPKSPKTQAFLQKTEEKL